MTCIQDKAMLASLNISQWTARKMDKGASQTTAETYHAEASEISTYKSTIQKKHLDKIQKIVGKARTMHYKFTTPYTFSKGQAILATAMLPDYMAEGSKLIREFDAAVSDFMAVYADVRNEAKGSLGDLYNDFDYPNEQQLRRKFSISYDFAPIPKGSHLQISISEDELAEMQKDIEEKVKDSMSIAMDELWQRVYQVTSALKERMTPQAGQDKTFRDTLIGNIAELADILPKMNITGDAQLDEVAADLRRDLAGYDPATLRVDRGMRKEAARRADAILDKVSRRAKVAASMEIPQAPAAPAVVAPEVEPKKIDVQAAQVSIEEVLTPKAPAKAAEPAEDDENIKRLKAAGII
jgi:hypothetical protein